jgi:hypothetical protein
MIHLLAAPLLLVDSQLLQLLPVYVVDDHLCLMHLLLQIILLLLIEVLVQLQLHE